MSTEYTKELVRRYRQAHNMNRLDQLDAIADDKIVEHWAEADFLGLAQQLVFRLKNGLATSQLRHDGLR
jgi:hypothetical protein